MIDLKNHFCLQQAESLKAINAPLKLIGIDNFFNVTIDLKTQKRHILTDHPSWTHFYYKNDLHHENLARCVETPNFWEMYLWNDVTYTKTAKLASEFQILSGITLFKTSKEKHEFYFFSTKNQIDSNYFMSIKNYLNEYIQYFHCEANTLIKDSKKYSFSIEKPALIQKTVIDKAALQKFQKSIQIDKLIINDGDEYLTHSEILCAYLLLKGETAKTTANILRVSDRTVETHLSNIKKKLNAKNQATLFSVLFESRYANEIITYADRVFNQKIRDQKLILREKKKF